MTDQFTDDEFLGGRLRLLQPKNGYRAGIDPVLLASAVPAKPGENVLDLGCGVGTALFCLASRVADLGLHGLEIDAPTADLARKNAARNGFQARIECGDVTQMPAALKSLRFDHVLTNPPYYARAARTAAQVPPREAALSGADVALWMDAAIRRLRDGGSLTVIHDAGALPDLMRALDDRVGAVEVFPLAPRMGRAARRVILRARKGSGAPFRLYPPTILHEGASHCEDGEDYTAAIRNILREGAAFE